MTLPANLRGWGQGWPRDRSDDMRRVTATRSGADFDVHYEIAPLIKFLIDEVERRGYLIDHGAADVDDDWSYANRAIRGRNTPSNHSWGLAIDIDAQEYGLGSYRRLPQWVVDLFEAYGFDYGGDWSGRKDPMHFEFNGWPSQARWLVASLAGHHIDNTPAPVPPSVPPPPAPEDLRFIQRLLQEDDDMVIIRDGIGIALLANGKCVGQTLASLEALRDEYAAANRPLVEHQCRSDAEWLAFGGWPTKK